MLLAVRHRIMMHLEDLESAKAARSSLGDASSNTYASSVLSTLPVCVRTLRKCFVRKHGKRARARAKA